MPDKFKRVQVVWHDAFSTDAWTDIDGLDKNPLEVTSIGYLVAKTKDTVVVAGTIGQGQACCVIHIPRGMVKSMAVLPKGGR